MLDYLSQYRQKLHTLEQAVQEMKVHPNKGLTGILFGSQELYDWADQNPGLIGRNDNMVSINNCISVDLYAQVCVESVGFRQISGTGGQLDYLTGASISKGQGLYLHDVHLYR